jgi:cytosine/adenosine deaminase-related metal-dependent hydrolase
MDLLNEFRSVICLGTDSLASNDRLSILEEMLTLKQAFNLNWQDLIQFATYNGAKALGFENELGTFEIGKNPGINLISFKEDQPRITVIDTNFYSKN